MHAVKHNQQVRILTIQIAVAADDDPEEGEVFGLLDFHLTITTPEE